MPNREVNYDATSRVLNPDQTGQPVLVPAGSFQFTGIASFDSNGKVVFNLGTVNGTQIGATSGDKLSFFGVTPNTQPSGDIVAALGALGLVDNPTVSAGSSTITADQTQVPNSNTGTIQNFVNWFANLIKGITGKTDWKTPPDTTLATANTHILNTLNPHATTAAQVGLGLVQNVDQTNASNITSGTLAYQRMGSGGDGSGTHFLRDNNTFGSSPSGATISHTTSLIKGDNAGNGVAATVGTDFAAATPAGTAVLKANNAGGFANAVDGTDYLSPTGAATVTTKIMSGSSNTFTNIPDTALSTAMKRQTASTVVLSGTTPAIDWSLTESFSETLTGNTTYTFSNATDPWEITVTITNTVSNYTVTFPGSVVWVGGSQPVQTVGAHTDIWAFMKVGTTIYGTVKQNY